MHYVLCVCVCVYVGPEWEHYLPPSVTHSCCRWPSRLACVSVCVCVSDVISRSILYAYRAKQTIKAFMERQLFLDAINLLHLQITVDYSRSF